MGRLTRDRELAPQSDGLRATNVRRIEATKDAATGDGIRLRWRRPAATMRSATWWRVQSEVAARHDASQNEAVPRADATRPPGVECNRPSCSFPVEQADDAGRARGAVDRTTRSLRQHIGEPFGRERRATSDGLRFTAKAQSAQRRKRFGERRLRAASDVRKSTNRANGRCSTNNEVASGKRRTASDGQRTMGDEVASNEVASGERRQRTTWAVASEVRRRAKPRATRPCRTSRWCRPQPGCCGSHTPLGAAAHRRAVRPQSDGATGVD